MNEYLRPLRERRKYYENHLDEVREIIEKGSAKARIEAQKVLEQVQDAVKMYK